jgi:DNA-binding transcriptional LysR family regulator
MDSPRARGYGMNSRPSQILRNRDGSKTPMASIGDDDDTARRRMTVRAATSELELRQLRAFVALVEQGSMTGAARTLGLAQSTVSESLLALERTLGARVVLRRRGRQDAKLSEAGLALLPHARTILAAVEGAHTAVAGATTNALGSVQIIANESITTYVLPAATAKLRARWPRTQFVVSVAACEGVREGVASGEFDVGLLLEARGDRGLATPRPISRSEHRIVAPAVDLIAFTRQSHPLSGGVVRRDALARYPLFISDATGAFHALVRRFVTGDRARPTRLEAAGSVEGVKKGVMGHPDAIGFLPKYAIAEELRAGSIAVLNLRPAPPRLRLDALLSPSRVRHPATDALLEALCEEQNGSAR